MVLLLLFLRRVRKWSTQGELARLGTMGTVGVLSELPQPLGTNCYYSFVVDLLVMIQLLLAKKTARERKSLSSRLC